MMPFPFDRDTRLDLMLSEREHALRQGALRAAIRDRQTRSTRRPFASRISGLMASMSGGLRAAPRPSALPDSVGLPAPDRLTDTGPANVIPIARKRSLAQAVGVSDSAPCTCGCMDGS